MMNGWKTYLAAGIVAISAGLEFMGYGTYATVLVMVGNALGLAGIRSAISTSSNSAAVDVKSIKDDVKIIKAGR